MSRRGGMQEVELEDARPPVVPVAAAAPRRRLRWWWVGAVAVAVVGALVGTQAVLDGRDRAAQDRFAAVPGVVAPVGSGVRVLWHPSEAVSGLVLAGLQAHGAFVGLSVADDGSKSILAVDQQTGAERWSTPVSGPDPVQALDRRVAGRCALAPADEIACLVGDGSRRLYTGGGPAVTVARSTRVVVVDTRDGHVVADRYAKSATSMAILSGLAVLGAPGEDVIAQDLVTGDVRWRYTPPGAGADLSQAAFSSAAKVVSGGDVVGVSNPGWSVAVLDASGAVLRTPEPAVAGYRYDPVLGVLALLSTTGSGQVRSSLVRTGTDAVDVPGTYLEVAVDDGSVPDLVLTSDAALRGWDERTGAARWTAREIATGSALVLQGRVYVPTTTGTVALDGRTGEVVWRSTLTDGHVPGSLATDGRSLLVADQPVAGSERSELVAYALDDGHALWRAPLPAGIRSSTSVGRVLLGLTSDGAVVLG